jgi:hypothetical protein
LQEDIERRAFAVSVTASKLTGRVLAKVFAAVLRKLQKGQPPKGRQSVKKLMGHGVNTNTIPLDENTRLFDRVARRWNVDYAFRKTGPKKYLLVFKAGQADAITQCLSEYTKRMMKQERRQSVLGRMGRLNEKIRQRPREREHKREAAHDR